MRLRKAKGIIGLVLALVLVLGAAVTSYASEASKAETFDIQILWTSDIHGAFSDWSYSTNSATTGLGRVASEIIRLREEHEHTVLIDVGDATQGNGTSVFHTDIWDEAEANDGLYPVLAGMEYLGYEAWVLGNHEFNFGADRLMKSFGYDEEKSLFSGAVLAGNVYDKDDKPVFDSFYIRDFTEDGGPRIAFVSMTHPNSNNWDLGNMTAAGWHIKPAHTETQLVIEYLKSEEAVKLYGEIDLFIAAQHMTTGDSYNPGDSVNDVIELNKDDLSLFIGAHGHTDQTVLVDGVWYGELRNAAARLGQVQLTATKTKDGWVVFEDDVAIELIPITTSTPTDSGYMEAVSGADKFAKEYSATVIGKLEGGPLVPPPEIRGTYQAYLEDTALVHIINDAMLYYANEYVLRTPELAEQDIQVTLAGTAPLDTNANAQPGNLTRGSVSTIYKYDNNTLNIVEMTGRQFKRWMEWSNLFFGEYTGDGTAFFDMDAIMEDGDLTIPYGSGNMPGYNFDAFSGVSYKVDLTKPYGERIVDMKYEGTDKDFDLDATYWVAVNNYRSDSQLTVNAGEGSRPAVFPAGETPATLIASNVDAVLTIDGEDPLANGEGMLGLMVDWINRVKGGTITNKFTANWEFITPDIDEELREKAVQLINAGIISNVPEAIGDSRGHPYARRAIKAEEVEDISDILTIYSFNDFHGTVDKSASGSNPGADRFTAVVQYLMEDNDNSLLLAAGDNYQGSPLSNLNYGQPVAEMMKYLGVEYSAVGNHEFDWGWELIELFAELGDTTFLAANIVDAKTGETASFAEPYAVVTLGGKTIGLIGFRTSTTPAIVKAENTEGLKFLEPGEWLSELANTVREEHDCDLVIALTHMGVSQNSETGELYGEAVELAMECPEFDAIIAAHSHNWAAGYAENGIPIVQGGYNGRGISRLTIVYEGDDFEIYPMFYSQNDMNTNAILPNIPLVVNTDVKELIKGFQDEIGPLFAVEAGTYGEDIDSRDKQAEWATNLVHAYIERITEEEYILFQNGGGWRDTSPYDKKADDPVTMGYLYTLMPFDNEIVLLQMRGKDILYMLGLEVGGDAPNLVSKAWVAGAYEEDGTWFTAAGDEIDPDKIYNVACNDFMLTGGDRFPFPGSAPANDADVEVIGESSFMGVPLRDAMVQELLFRAE